MDRRKDIIREVTGPAISGLVLSALYVAQSKCDVRFIQRRGLCTVTSTHSLEDYVVLELPSELTLTE